MCLKVKSSLILVRTEGRAPACVSKVILVLALRLSPCVNLHLFAALQTHRSISKWNAWIIFRSLYMVEF